MPLINDFRITTLYAAPQFRAFVSNRLWHAWWRDNGFTLQEIDDRVGECLNDHLLPTTFVAHHQNTFLGTISLIDNDMEQRPQYSPWLAALWVDPDYRNHGIAKELIRVCLIKAFSAGIKTVFLCATEDNSTIYLSLGWTLVEKNIIGWNIFAYSADLNAEP